MDGMVMPMINAEGGIRTEWLLSKRQSSSRWRRIKARRINRRAIHSASAEGDVPDVLGDREDSRGIA